VETFTADKWLYATLTGDTTLMALVTGVHTWPVLQDTPLPYVLFQEQSARDMQGMGPARIWVTGTWLVRIVAETRSWGGTLETTANRLDTLIQAASGTVTGGGRVFVCVREAPFRLVETVQSREFRHMGGIYRIMAR